MGIIKKFLNSESIYFEFLRYVFVGGIAFVADYLSLYIFYEYVFKKMAIGIYIATSIAFLFGLSINYVLSLVFVFVSKKDKSKGRNTKAFIIFAAIGLIGLGLTELGMYIGVDILKSNYMIIKVIIAVLVLFWNYIGRKVFVFNK